MPMLHISRDQQIEEIRQLVRIFPVTTILGPRQVGKTTLAKRFNPDHTFDLENPRDVASLDHPQLLLENLKGLIMIDEIQRKPSLFPLLRFLVDTQPDQKYLLLGSASSHLKEQGGESLAGRIGYHDLSGLTVAEVGADNMQKRWVRGGFPRSFLAESDEDSALWRSNFISTFLERDLGSSSLSSGSMYRFWVMLSHYHGQTLNYSELGRSFGVSDKTVKQYISLLENAFMVRLLFPWHANVGKRLVKSPKLYLRDSGLFHSLQNISGLSDLHKNPRLGASWEGFALEELLVSIRKRDNEVFFYGSQGGMELDLFWQDRGKGFGVEFKYQDAPKSTKSMQQAIQDLDLDHLWVIYPGDSVYSLSEKITALPLTLLGQIRAYISAS